MKLFLGVDGGQTDTTAMIGDDGGRILGTGEAGPCNHAAAEEGRMKLQRAIMGSVGAACAQAGLDPAAVRFEAACFGLSGGPEEKEAILAKILRADRVVVTTDAVTALAGATHEGRGIIAIGGTGSISFGRNAAGRTARAGGWGYIYGDEGSAFDIGRQALRAALRMEEGWGPETSLRSILLDATSSESANFTLHLFYGPEWPRSRVARLGPLVDEAAIAGDAVAQEILDRAAQELAIYAGAVRTQLWRPGEEIEVAYLGGVFRSDRVRERFRMLVELEDGVRCSAPLRGPAEGALLEAYRAAGLTGISDLRHG